LARVRGRLGFLPRGWDVYADRLAEERRPKTVKDMDPDELNLCDLRRRSDRLRLHAALGFDQTLIRELGVDNDD